MWDAQMKAAQSDDQTTSNLAFEIRDRIGSLRIFAESIQSKIYGSYPCATAMPPQEPPNGMREALECCLRDIKDLSDLLAKVDARL